MIGFFTAISFVAALAFLGWLALRRCETISQIERMGLAYAIGAGSFSFALFLTSLLGIPFSPVVILAVYLLLTAIAYIIARRTSPNSISPAAIPQLDQIEILLLVVLGIISLVVFVVAVYWQPYVWDELAIWVLKGKLIAANDSPSLAAHPAYPLNLPYQIAALSILGSDSVHMIFFVYGASLALVVYSHLREETNRRIALVGTAILFSTTFLIYESTIAYANVPFALYYVASTLCLYRYLRSRRRTDAILSAVLLGLGAWTRTEAPLYFAINLAVLALFSPKDLRAVSHAVMYGSIFGALWAPWVLFVRTANYPTDFAVVASSAGEILNGRLDWNRLSQVANFALSRMQALPDWGALWVLLPLAVILGWRHLRESKTILTLIAFNAIGLLFTFYSLGADPTANPLEWSLNLGFDRVALQWAPLIVFYFGLALHNSGIMDGVLNSTRFRVDPYFALLMLFSIFAIGPLLGPGYFWGAHDGRHSVYFLFEFDRAIQDGVWYPRWAPDFTFGFGYPFFNIYAPGAFFVGEFLHLAGFDFVTATKIVFGLAIILSGPAMFGFVKRLTNSIQAAFLAGLVYVYVPYHIVDIYVRAALAELVALIFLPLTLWGFYEAVVNPSRKSLVAAALAYGAMHFTHNGIALLFTPVLIAWILFLMVVKLRQRHKPFFTRRMVPDGLRLAAVPFFGALLGVGLASIFVLPAVLEYQGVRTDQWLANYYDYTNHFAYLFQVFSPFWGFGISNAGPRDEMSFQLGVVPSLLAIFAIYSILKNANGLRRIWIFFLGLTLLTVTLMLPFSLPLWEALRLVTFAQFPWRLLTLTNVSLAILAGAIALHGPDNSANRQPNDQSIQSPDGQTIQRSSEATPHLSLPIILLGILIVFGSFPYLTAQTTVEAAEGPVSILGLLKFQQSAGEMTGVSAWVTDIPTWSPMADVYFAGKRVKSKIEFSEFNPDILYFGVKQDGSGIRSNGETVEFDAQDENQTVTWNIDYYPGWHVYLAEKEGNDLKVTRELPISIEGEHARIQVNIPQGRHWLILRFEDTLPRIAGTWISAASVFLVIVLLVVEARSNKSRV